MAGAAADLIDQGRAADILGTRSLQVISSRTGGMVSPSSLDNALEGTNVPLDMSRFDWAEVGARVASLNSMGYTNAEIAGAIRFDRYLREAIGWR